MTLLQTEQVQARLNLEQGCTLPEQLPKTRSLPYVKKPPRVIVFPNQITPKESPRTTLSRVEQAHLRKQLQREPNALERELVSAMWSEHCSYKSSRHLLEQLPKTSDRTLVQEGENAGAVRIGTDAEGRTHALVFKMESHNHPSMITPNEGAATGVGGIMRDILAMGARPVANLNALRFGDAASPKTKTLLKGVVEGIAFYGNCTGIPTLGGECDFDQDYNDNILVNAMTVGIAPVGQLCSARAKGEGNLVVYLGAKTGRDGINGATMASQGFAQTFLQGSTDAKTTETTHNKTQVQVGDPFAQKRLLEACIEAAEKNLLQALQDMGAAGLLSSSSEMADKGNIAMTLDLEKVPVRQPDLSPLELMLSESQERMLAIVERRHIKPLTALFVKHRLDCCVIGRLGKISEQPLLLLQWHGREQATLPVRLLGEAPSRRHKQTPRAAPPPVCLSADPPPILEALRTLLLSPRMLCKKWVTQQYDSLIGGQTLEGPGGEAALLCLEQTREILALTCDATPRYCRNDAKRGAMQAVCEAVRNLSATGATPLAVTDNLNFGNPEDPFVMGEASDTVAGLAEACRAFGLPVVSGNVSFYNETEGRSIPPTPVVGAVGIIEAGSNGEALPPFARALPHNGETLLFLLGESSSSDRSSYSSSDSSSVASLGASLYMQEVAAERRGEPPAIDFVQEKRNAAFLREAIARGLCRCARDLSCGGLLTKIALLAMQAGCGVRLSQNEVAYKAADKTTSDTVFWFGEQQARYLLCLTEAQAEVLTETAQQRGVALRSLGELEKAMYLTLPSGETMSLKTLSDEWRGGLARLADA